MLIKKELEAIPYCQPPIVKIAKKKDIYGRDDSCAAAAKVVKLPKSGKILVVDIFKMPAEEPKVRFFTDRKNYATLDVKNNMFTKAMPGNEYLEEKREYFSSPHSEQSTEDYKTVISFFKEKTDWREEIVHQVDGFVQKKRKEQQTRAYENKVTKRESLFKMMKPYGKTHNRFCEKKVFGETFLFFGKKEKAGREVICGSCGALRITKDNLKHKENGKCGACGKSAVYWQINYEPSIKQKQKLCVAQKYEGQLLMRWATVTRTFKDQKPVYSYEDYFRTFYMNGNGKPVIYNYALTCNYGCWDWRRKDYQCSERAFVFTDNLNKIFGEKYYNVDIKKEMEKSVYPVSFNRLLDRLQDTPEAEYLVKLGLYRLAAESKYIEFTGRKGFDSLGISKNYLPMYKMLDVSLHEHNIVSSSKVYVKAETVEKYRALGDVLYHTKTKEVFIENYSLEKYANYFSKQRLKNNRKIDDQLMFYEDYTKTMNLLCRPMNDKSTKFPDDLKRAHDEAMRDFKIVEDEAMNKLFKKRSRTLNAMYFYKNSELMITAPLKAQELTEEGEALNHCVARYATEHAAGKTTIMFIRKISAPKTPYFTAELNQWGNIVQIRRKGNLGKTPDITEFLKEWEKEVSKRNKKISA